MPHPLSFRGIIVPLVTPLAGRDRLDVAGLERIVEHVLDGGVHGLFLLGSTGEAPSLTERLKRELIGLAAAQARRRVPVLVGITDTSLVDSLELAQFAADQGAAAVVVAPPPYFPMNQAELALYIEQVAEESPLPVVLYNMPSHSKIAYEIETVRQVADLPHVAGIKDSSGDMMYFKQLLQIGAERPGLSILMGPEELLAQSVLMGGHGGVSGGANLHPRLYVELYDAAIDGDLNLVHRLQHRVLRLSSTLYAVGDPPSGYLTGLKSAMSCVGLCDDRLSEPLSALPADRRCLIEQHLRDLGLLDTTVRPVSRVVG